MKRYISWPVVLALVLASFAASGQNVDMENKAVASAEAWLDLVDGGKYADSWKQASEYFKNAVKLAQWEQSLVAVRKPLGKIISRKLSSKNYMNTTDFTIA